MLPFALSPSRASDFRNCPQLFKFRAIDRLPEPRSIAALRGTIAHVVLQRLYDHPAAARTVETALDLLDPAWDQTVAREDAGDLFESAEHAAHHHAETARFVRNYFDLEDPMRLEPAGREVRLEADLGELRVVGILDRLDRCPDGTWVVGDYKTGGTPDLGRSLSRFFGLSVSAVLVHRLTGQGPKRLRLLYLDTPDAYVLEPSERDVESTVRLLTALGKAISGALSGGAWKPRPGRLCEYCSFRDLCPAFGGTVTPTHPPAATPAPLGLPVG